MRMNKETLGAAHGGIKKWNKVVQKTSGVDKGWTDCPLCDLYYHKDEQCVGCPIDKKTGNGCRETPYVTWTIHQRNDHNKRQDLSRTPYCKECMRLAKAERAFLISLLPKKEREVWDV